MNSSVDLNDYVSKEPWEWSELNKSHAPSDTEHEDVYNDDIYKSDTDISIDDSDISVYKPSSDEFSDGDSIDIPINPKQRNTKKIVR